MRRVYYIVECLGVFVNAWDLYEAVLEIALPVATMRIERSWFIALELRASSPHVEKYASLVERERFREMATKSLRRERIPDDDERLVLASYPVEQLPLALLPATAKRYPRWRVKKLRSHAPVA